MNIAELPSRVFLDIPDADGHPATPPAGPDPDALLSTGFQVEVRTEPGPPSALVLTGEIDIAAVPAISAAEADLLFAAAARRGAGGHLDGRPDGRVVAVRLADATFLDCAALGALVRLQGRLGRTGCTLVLEDPEHLNPSVLRLLTLTRHTHRFLRDQPAG